MSQGIENSPNPHFVGSGYSTFWPCDVARPPRTPRPIHAIGEYLEPEFVVIGNI